MTIPNDVLSSISSQASGSTVTVSVEAVDSQSLTAAQKEAAGGDPVFDISILSGSTLISSFGGGSVTISLPYALKSGEDAQGVTVRYLNDAGQVEK